jgi:hypothetical protein
MLQRPTAGNEAQSDCNVALKVVTGIRQPEIGSRTVILGERCAVTRFSGRCCRGSAR